MIGKHISDFTAKDLREFAEKHQIKVAGLKLKELRKKVTEKIVEINVQNFKSQLI